MDNQMLGLIGIGVVAYLVLKNKEEDKVVPVTPPTPPLPPTPPAVPGCMDPSALNYNPIATIGDASCAYQPLIVRDEVVGCMDPTALNYDSTANVNAPASCVYTPIVTPISGCIDSLATNYDPLATIGDASCIYPVSGCMDQNASNYNPTATTACS